MTHFVLQQNAFIGREEMRGYGPAAAAGTTTTASPAAAAAFVSDPKDPVVCPRPRRVGVHSNHPIRPLRWHINQYSEFCDSKAGSDLLDMILTKENRGAEQCASEVASSPPFFSGSPPSRAANPLVHDARFGDEKVAPPFTAFPFPGPPLSLSPSSSARKGGCVRASFGLKPAAVRVEGFDCLNRDRQNSSIPAMA